MARVVGIDHLVIRVREFERSKAFYDTVLGFLGFTADRLFRWGIYAFAGRFSPVT